MPNNQIQSLTISGTTYDIVDNTSGYITADSPALTGTPTAPTPLSGADDTQIATVKYVQDAMAGAGAGTVTSVGVANATDGGLSVSGSPITGSGTISVGHSNVLASAQTTSGIYPIKIDKNGHISEYGSAISIPTKTSDLTNDSGYITSYTDENLKWTASTSSNTYYPLQSTSTATTSTANTLNGINFYQYYNTAGGYRRLNLGNATAWKSSGGAYGTIRLYGAAATYYGDLVPGTLGTTSGDGHISANRTWTLPDKTGTIALTSDIPTVPTITDTYSGTSQDGMSGVAVKSAIDALDGTVSGTAGAGKTLTAFSQTDGKVSATFGSISITKSQVSDFPSLATVATSGDYGDLINKPAFSGSTATKTPTEVKTAIDSGNFINITHLDPVYGLIQADNFNYSAGANSIVANVVFYYSLVGLLCFELIGNLNDDTWTNNVYVLARTSDIPTVPTNVSAFTNDAGYLTSYTETDPTVPSWAKAESKPTYTASEVGALASNTTYVSKITTTAGAHTAISNQSGAISFNVPTKTSHLTNDSGYITSDSDEKVKSAAVTAATTYYLIGSTNATTETATTSKHGSVSISVGADSNTSGGSRLTLGNSTAEGTAGAKYGYLRLYGNTTHYVDLQTEASYPTANRTIYLPSYGGTMYLTCTSTTDAVGNTSVPVYVDNTGRIQAVDSIAIGLIDKPFMRATGSTTNVNLSGGTITQIPLYTVEFQSEYSGISLDTTKHTILLEPGYYRISGSIYFASGTSYSSSQGIYIRMDSTSIAFANATEVAASYIYGCTSINTSTIVKVIDNCYLWLGARSSTAAVVDSDNTATYLTVEKIGSVY